MFEFFSYNALTLCQEKCVEPMSYICYTSWIAKFDASVIKKFKQAIQTQTRPALFLSMYMVAN